MKRTELGQQFVRFALECNVLKFGEFITKAGRLSPYFFNAGLFDDGNKFALLVSFYAQKIAASQIEFDVIFGAAYKGIPLAAGIAIELAKIHGKNYPFAFNRKEAKDHGEGGSLIGAPLKGKVLIVDDVISAGTATKESINIIRQAGAEPTAILIGIDRQEKIKENGNDLPYSAVQYIQKSLSLPVYSIATLDDLLQFLDHNPDFKKHYAAIAAYRSAYGALDDA